MLYPRGPLLCCILEVHCYVVSWRSIARVIELCITLNCLSIFGALVTKTFISNKLRNSIILNIDCCCCCCC